MSTATLHRYIIRRPDVLGGEPVIEGSRVPVRAIVETSCMGYTPEGILAAFPHLSLAKVYDALSYYHDNVDEIERYIGQNRITDDVIDPRFRDK